MPGGAILRITTVVTDKASPALKRIDGELSKLPGGMARVDARGVGMQRSLDKTGKSAGLLGTGLSMAGAATAAAVVALGAFTIKSFAAAGAAEKHRQQISKFVGTAKELDDVFTALDNFADFSLIDDQSVMDAASALLTAGVAADDLVTTLTALGDATVGQPEKFAALAQGMAAMGAKSLVTAKGLTGLQAATDIPVIPILAKELGVTTQRLEEMARTGKLLSKDALPALTRGLAGAFGGQLEAQSKTFLGLIGQISNGAEDVGKAFVGLFAPIQGPILQMVIDGLKSIEATFKALASNDQVQAFVGALGEAFMSIGDALEAVGPLLFDIAMTLIQFLTPALQVFAAIMRTVASIVRAVGSALKPLFDFLRLVAQQIKSIIGYLLPFVAAFFRIKKAADDAGGGVGALLSALNPFGPGLDVATRAAILFADALLALTLYKAIEITVSAATAVATAAVAGLQLLLIAISKTWQVFVDVDIRNNALSRVSQLLTILTGLTIAAYTISVAVDPGGTQEIIDGLKKSVTDLVTPEIPYTVTIMGETESLKLKIEAMGTAVSNLVNGTYIVQLLGNASGANQMLADFAANLALIPSQITIGFGLDFGGIDAGIQNLKAALASIPRMITTVLRTITGEEAVPDVGAGSPSIALVPGVQSGTGSQIFIPPIPIRIGGGSGAGSGGGAGVGVGRQTGDTGCFSGDTVVHTPLGLRRIDMMRIGDLIRVREFQGDTHRKALSVVTDTMVHEEHATLILTLAGKPITTTADHRWLALDFGWIRAQDIRIGDRIATASGFEVVTDIVEGVTQTVYNLHVAHDDHNYHVGESGYVVHNFKTASMLATGGIVTRATRAIVGEAGPEAVIPLDSMQGRSMLGDGGGSINIGSLTINVGNGFDDPNAAGAAAADAFRRQLGLQRRLLFGTA